MDFATWLIFLNFWTWSLQDDIATGAAQFGEDNLAASPRW